MAKGINQKRKLLYLKDILSRETDETHGLTMKQIIEELARYDVSADRKTIYQDLEELSLYGLDILSEHRGRDVVYYLGSRDFELAELKLLVDSVQSAKFISQKKSRQLIAKLGTLLSRYEAGRLSRQVLLTNRVKTVNESIYYTVDDLHNAMLDNVQIRFRYGQWTVKKTMEPRRGGRWYQVSPWALLWDDEYYYLIGYDPLDKKIKHYRVDKMMGLTRVEEPREGEKEYAAQEKAVLGDRVFSMYGGEPRRVSLEADNSLAGVFLDRFGTDMILRPAGEDRFATTLEVEVSPPFLGWLFALGDKVVITAPDDLREEMKKEARRLLSQYEN